MHWNSYLQQTIDALRAVDPVPLDALANCILNAWGCGKTVFTCGNGGSASNASHLAQDLSKGTLVEGVSPLRTICLCDNISALTAWANDSGYEYVFSESLRALGRAGDVLVAISGSGNSPNVLRAVRTAHGLQMRTWGVCGFGGGRPIDLAHRSVHVPCGNMGIVEGVHGVLFHWLVETLRARQARTFSIVDAA